MTDSEIQEIKAATIDKLAAANARLTSLRAKANDYRTAIRKTDSNSQCGDRNDV